MNKKELRKVYKEKRQELSSEQKKVLSKQIAERLINEFDLTDKRISIFLPIERFSEINSWEIINEVTAEFILPVIKGNNDLVHIKYESTDQIEVSDWGIPEPTYGIECKTDSIDIVLVPLLAIDTRGYRVGYGKGFYDRFLSSCKRECVFIGLNYFELIERIDDVHDGDVPLHYCVSPNKINSFKI
jgi:5-formyltetrahydrofolate cyclo-ligase